MTLTKKIAAGFVALGLCALVALPAFAATTASVTQGTTPTNANTANTDIKIEAEISTVSVTVPTEMVMVFNADGTNAIPSDFSIKNESTTKDIILDKITYTGANGWTLAGASDTLAVDDQKIRLSTKVGSGSAVLATGGADSFNATIAKGGTPTIVTFTVERPLYNTQQALGKAYTMKMDFKFAA